MQTKEVKSLTTILDTSKPDWWLVYATQQELIDCVRGCTDGRSGTVAARDKLRRDVAARIAEIGRAGVIWQQQF